MSPPHPSSAGLWGRAIARRLPGGPRVGWGGGGPAAGSQGPLWPGLGQPVGKGGRRSGFLIKLHSVSHRSGARLLRQLTLEHVPPLDPSLGPLLSGPGLRPSGLTMPLAVFLALLLHSPRLCAVSLAERPRAWVCRAPAPERGWLPQQ